MFGLCDRRVTAMSFFRESQVGGCRRCRSIPRSVSGNSSRPREPRRLHPAGYKPAAATAVCGFRDAIAKLESHS